MTGVYVDSIDPYLPRCEYCSGQLGKAMVGHGVDHEPCDSAPERVWVPADKLPTVRVPGDEHPLISGRGTWFDRPLAVGDRVPLVTDCAYCEARGSIPARSGRLVGTVGCPKCNESGSVRVGSATVTEIVPVVQDEDDIPDCPAIIVANPSASSARYWPEGVDHDADDRIVDVPGVFSPGGHGVRVADVSPVEVER